MEYIYIFGLITLVLVITQYVKFSKFNNTIQSLKHFFDEGIEWKKIEVREYRDRLPNARLEDVFNLERTVIPSMMEKVQLVNYPEGASEETNKALHIINTYILHSWTVETDFLSVKDITEREGRKIEKNSQSRVLSPFYIGFASFLLFIASAIICEIYPFGWEIMKAETLLILPLLFGMLLSFRAYVIGKQAIVQLESNKTKFYNWIQTDIIPVSNYDVYGMMNSVSKGLKEFSDKFSESVEELGIEMEDFGKFYALQEKTAKTIEDLKLEQMAKTNMNAIQELSKSVGPMTSFAKGMKEMAEFLSATRELNKNLKERDKRTEALAVIADYYEKQMVDIETRQDAIRTTVVKIDDQMQSALKMMEDRAKEGMEHLRQTLLHQMEEMERMSRSTTLDEKLGNIDTALKAVSLLTPMQETMNQLSERLRDLNSGIKSLDKASQEMLQESNKVRKENEKQLNRLTSELATEHKNLMSRIFSSRNNTVSMRFSKIWSKIVALIYKLLGKKRDIYQKQPSNVSNYHNNKKGKKDKPYVPKNINRV